MQQRLMKRKRQVSVKDRRGDGLGDSLKHESVGRKQSIRRKLRLTRLGTQITSQVDELACSLPKELRDKEMKEEEEEKEKAKKNKRQKLSWVCFNLFGD
jgi:hypothetical protein